MRQSHEDRYLNGAAVQHGGRYDADKHVRAQCRDSDESDEPGSVSKVAAVLGGISGLLDRLAR